MSKISDLNTELEGYVEDAEAIKVKVKDVANNKDISISSNIDTPLTVLTKIDNGTIKTPSGTINITENSNDIDVTNYATANVNVASQSTSNVYGTSTTYFSENYSGSFVSYLFYITRNLNEQITHIIGLSNNKSGTSLSELMQYYTLMLSHTDTGSVTLDYDTPYQYSSSVGTKSYRKNLGMASSVITFLKNDGVTPFTIADINTSKNYQLVFSDATWNGNYENMTNFNIKAIVTQL